MTTTALEHTMSISPKFFRNERNNYSNWPFAFWRELFQNSTDAFGSRSKYKNRIDITVTQDDEGTAIVDFNDNGPGFSREVLENVFFCLGETTKTGDDSIGGFGKARMLTHFSHHSYEGRSQDWSVRGQGSSYSIDDHAWTEGCNFHIKVDAINKYDYKINMKRNLFEYLSFAQLDCSVYVNGTEFNEWCHRRTHITDLSFGRIFANKSGGKHPGYLIVRVYGAPMYSTMIRGKAQVILEIDAAKSRNVLVSNRDSLDKEQQDELNRYIQKLTIDTKSALKRDTKKTILVGNVPHETKRKTDKKKEEKKETIVNSNPLTGFVDSYKPIIGEPKDETAYERHIFIDALVHSAVIVCESTSPSIRAVYPSYVPTSWGFVPSPQKNGKRMYKGKRKKDLLKLWTVILDMVIEEHLDMIDEDFVKWQPGFVFSDSYGACYLKSDYNAFLLNPVDSDGKMNYSIRKQESWGRLLSLACHEVTHLRESYHDEEFSSLHTQLTGRMIGRVKEVFKRLSEVVNQK